MYYTEIDSFNLEAILGAHVNKTVIQSAMGVPKSGPKSQLPSNPPSTPAPIARVSNQYQRHWVGFQSAAMTSPPIIRPQASQMSRSMTMLDIMRSFLENELMYQVGVSR